MPNLVIRLRAFLWVFAAHVIASLADFAPSHDAASCQIDIEDTAVLSAPGAGADDSKVGSCLLQSGTKGKSLLASLRTVALEEGGDSVLAQMSDVDSLESVMLPEGAESRQASDVDSLQSVVLEEGAESKKTRTVESKILAWDETLSDTEGAPLHSVTKEEGVGLVQTASTDLDSVDSDQTPSQEDDDQVDDEYFRRAKRILDEAARSTPPPHPILVDAPAGGRSWRNMWSSRPWVQGWNSIWYDATQPMNTRIGAALLYHGSVDEFTYSTPTPPPTRDYVRSAVHGNCPMVFLQHQLEIYPPKCGETLGSWVAPDAEDDTTEREIIRWEKEGHGMRFGVDSSVDGKGGATYAKIKPRLVLDGYKFAIFNCLDYARFGIEEQVIKVEHMGAHDDTGPHDPATDGEQHFLRYFVTAEDGSVLMQTNLFRVYSSSFNLTTVTAGPDGDMSGASKVVASMTRRGEWHGNGWHSCKRNSRGWHLEFDEDLRQVNDTGTMLDMRILASMAVTFIASREEERNAETGMAPSGETEVFLNFVWSGIVLLIAALICCFCCCLCYCTGCKDKSRKFCFRFEGAIMPKRPHTARAPALNPVY